MRIIVIILFAVFVANLSGQADSAVSRSAVNAPTRFSVAVRGEGPHVILIPGLSSTRDTFEATAAQLAQSHRVHLVQLKGFGEPAGANAHGPVLQPFVDELEAYIRAGKLEQPAVIGHSMGGLAALMLAAQAPAVPGKLMIVDAFPFIGPVFGADSVDALRPRAEQMRVMLLGNAPNVTPQFGTRPQCTSSGPPPTVSPGSMTNSALGACMVKHGVLASDLRVVAQAMYDDMVTDMRPKLGTIDAPVTVLYPQDDRALPQANADSLYANAYSGTGKLTLVRVPGSLHFIMQDQPERFAREVDAFLKR